MNFTVLAIQNSDSDTCILICRANKDVRNLYVRAIIKVPLTNVSSETLTQFSQIELDAKSSSRLGVAPIQISFLEDRKLHTSRKSRWLIPT